MPEERQARSQRADSRQFSERMATVASPPPRARRPRARARVRRATSATVSSEASVPSSRMATLLGSVSSRERSTSPTVTSARCSAGSRSASQGSICSGRSCRVKMRRRTVSSRDSTARRAASPSGPASRPSTASDQGADLVQVVGADAAQRLAGLLHEVGRRFAGGPPGRQTGQRASPARAGTCHGQETTDTALSIRLRLVGHPGARAGPPGGSRGARARPAGARRRTDARAGKAPALAGRRRRGSRWRRPLAERLRAAGAGHDLGPRRHAQRYPDFAEAWAAIAGAGRARILVCGSGVGAVAAPTRCRESGGLCHDTYSAHQGVEHDR